MASSKKTTISTPVYKPSIRKVKHQLSSTKKLESTGSIKTLEDEPLQVSRQSDDDTDHSGHIETIVESLQKGNFDKVKPPRINFYSTIPNALGVFCNGMLTLRELSATFGTIIPILVGTLPMLVLGIAMLFMPDLTTLGLPLFYPNGADGDPLAAFPLVPDIDTDELAQFAGDFLHKSQYLLGDVK